VIHDGMPCDPVQGHLKVTDYTEVWKLRKWLNSKSISSAQSASRRPTANYVWYFKTIS